MKVVLIPLISLLLLTGCLRTREDVKAAEATVAMREQVTTIQKVNADSASRMDELSELNRNLNGRVEDLEHRLVILEKEKQAAKEELQQSLAESKQASSLLQESVAKMETQVQALQEEIVALRTKDTTSTVGRGESSKANVIEKEKSIFDAALASFEEKKWKDAILNFDQYREKNPKGKFAAEATYKLGVCFQELGMRDDAKVFYQETLEKFPQSDMAKKARFRLKALK